LNVINRYGGGFLRMMSALRSSLARWRSSNARLVADTAAEKDLALARAGQPGARRRHRRRRRFASPDRCVSRVMSPVWR
jgi:type VI protein secretion system component VasF